MNKKIMTLLLAGLMLLMAIPVSASQAYLDVSVSASSADIGVGDTVEYVVTASCEDVLAVQFELVIPEGLCYVPNSAATPQGLAQKLGVAAADWTEDTMMFTYYNDVGIHMKEGTELLRFTCRAEKEGKYEITIHELLPYDSAFEGFAPSVYVQPVKVSGSAGAEQDPDLPPVLDMPSDEEPVEEHPLEPDKEPLVPEEDPLPGVMEETGGERSEGPQMDLDEGPEDSAHSGEEPGDGKEKPDFEEEDDEVKKYPVYKPQPSHSKLKAVLPWIIGGGIPIIILLVLLLIPRKKK